MSTSAAETKRWNRLGDTMNHFHSYFKQEFDTVYELADGSFAKRGLSLSRYLGIAKQLNSHLSVHHRIEEQWIFPVLAKRMPQFSTETDDAHIASHKGIHDGLEALELLVQKYTEEPSTYSPTEMRACLDGFRGVLFKHLDEEVADLQGENLKKYWTLEELDAIEI